MRSLLITYLTILSLFLHACSILPAPDDDTEGWSAQRLYAAAKSNMAQGNYEEAIQLFETLEARYPFGRYAKQGQVEIAYAYYKFDEPESAIAAADRFIKLHPRHPHVDYAHYLKGLIHFNRQSGFLSRLFEQDLSDRDPASARQAFSEFSALVRKFPESRYAPDARLRALFLRNSLAKHELHVANYYYKRGAYIAVVNRCKYVLENYDQASAVPDALILLARAYDKLDMKTLAADARRVLQASYPDHAKRAQQDRSWWNPF